MTLLKNLIALSREASSPLRICENSPPMVPEGLINNFAI